MAVNDWVWTRVYLEHMSGRSDTVRPVTGVYKCAIWDVMVQRGMHARFGPAMLQSIWSTWVRAVDAVQLVASRCVCTCVPHDVMVHGVVQWAIEIVERRCIKKS